MDKASWVVAFTAAMMELGVRAEREQIASMAGELYETRGGEDAEAVAKDEWAAWPPHDD